ncbi:MAG: hypothetical protein AAFX06_33155 [Planctomycetota bacterium]
MNVRKQSVQASGNGPTEQAGVIPEYVKREHIIVAVTADTWGVASVAALEATVDGAAWFPVERSGTPITFTENGCAEVPALLGYRISVTSFAGCANLALTVVR